MPMALPRRPYLLGLLPGTSNDWATQDGAVGERERESERRRERERIELLGKINEGEGKEKSTS